MKSTISYSVSDIVGIMCSIYCIDILCVCNNALRLALNALFVARSKFLSDKWMCEKGFLREEDLVVNKPW